MEIINTFKQSTLYCKNFRQHYRLRQLQNINCQEIQKNNKTSHLSDIRTCKKYDKPVSIHFNSKDHSIDDFIFAGIEISKKKNTIYRQTRESLFIIPSPTKLRRDIVTLPSVLPSVCHILVNTLGSTSFNGF